MKITRVETIVVNMPMLIEGSVVPKQGGRARTSAHLSRFARIAASACQARCR